MDQHHMFRTLPDYLAPGLDIILVGINPGQYSVERGRYFARPQSRFWPALSKSKLSEHARRALDVTALVPEHDELLPNFGIGLTDIVKRPTNNAAELTAADFEEWVPITVEQATPTSSTCCVLSWRDGLPIIRPNRIRTDGTVHSGRTTGTDRCHSSLHRAQSESGERPLHSH